MLYVICDEKEVTKIDDDDDDKQKAKLRGGLLDWMVERESL